MQKQREPTEGRAARFKYEVRKRSLLAGGDLNLSPFGAAFAGAFSKEEEAPLAASACAFLLR